MKKRKRRDFDFHERTIELLLTCIKDLTISMQTFYFNSEISYAFSKSAATAHLGMFS